MRVIKAMFRQPSALFGLTVVTLVILLAVAAPLIAPFSPDEQMFDGLTLEGAPIPPRDQFLLGTDALGRDMGSGHPSKPSSTTRNTALKHHQTNRKERR